MPSKSRQAKERERLLQAMQPLCLLPSFQAWIETLRETKDAAVQYMVDHTSVASERESLVARGEVRAYLAIIGDYEAQLEALEAQAEYQQNLAQD